MTVKAKGGRGKKAENPYERFTVTLPPDLRRWLDAEAIQHGLSRSELLANVLREIQTAHAASQPKPKGTPLKKRKSTANRQSAVLDAACRKWAEDWGCGEMRVVTETEATR